MERKKKILTKNLDPRKRRLRRIRIAVTTVLAVFIVLVVACLGVGEYLVQFAVGPADIMGDASLDPGAGSTDVDPDIAANTEAFGKQTSAWLETVDEEDWSVVADDGAELVGHYYPAEEATHNFALVLHGYRSTYKSMQDLAYVYNDKMGFNCLLPEMRACGNSGGDYVGMGYLDSRDMLHWIDAIEEKDPQAQILITGISMGGATTMMTAGLEELPDSVVCFVEDCGYTSVWDMFAFELDNLFHLPPFPLLYFASAICDVQVGYSFQEASAIEAVRDLKKPMLFIHGEEDTFVNYAMLQQLYDACLYKDNKKMLSIPGAGHGESYKKDPKTYFSTVYEFIKPYFDLNVKVA